MGRGYREGGRSYATYKGRGKPQVKYVMENQATFWNGGEGCRVVKCVCKSRGQMTKAVRQGEQRGKLFERLVKGGGWYLRRVGHCASRGWKIQFPIYLWLRRTNLKFGDGDGPNLHIYWKYISVWVVPRQFLKIEELSLWEEKRKER